VYLLYIFPGAPHTYDFVALTSLTHPRKILLVVLLQIGKAKDLSAPLRIRVGYTICLVSAESLSTNMLKLNNLQVSMEGVHDFIELKRLVYNSNTTSKLVISTCNKQMA
jgi:hypothetical protein